MTFLNKEHNQILNLIKFNVNFSKFSRGNDPLSQSPDYILEKYEHWIGFVPTVEHKVYTPDDMIDFFNKYWKIWRPSSEILTENKFKNILMYLYSTQNMNLLQMVNKFEEYIGPVENISYTSKKGLHYVLNEFVDTVLEKNKDNLKVVLRDMKIGNII